MKVCVVVPTFRRPDITILCVKRILDQTIKPFRVIVVGSEECDRKVAEVHNIDYIERPNYYYKETTRNERLSEEEERKFEWLAQTSLKDKTLIPYITTDSKGHKYKLISTITPVRALGDKVQAGVQHCRNYNPDAILMCGSDDLLSLNWTEKMLEYIKQYDVIGTDHLYTLSFNPLNLMINSYKGTLRYGEPAGPGRVISSRVLNKLNWELYPPGLSQNLDKNSFAKLNSVNAKFYLYTGDEAKILSVKGPWEHITTLENLRTISCEQISDPKKWIFENDFSQVFETFSHLMQ